MKNQEDASRHFPGDVSGWREKIVKIRGWRDGRDAWCDAMMNLTISRATRHTSLITTNLKEIGC